MILAAGGKWLIAENSQVRRMRTSISTEARKYILPIDNFVVSTVESILYATFHVSLN